MTLIDEFSRKCLAIRVARRINAICVIKKSAVNNPPSRDLKSVRAG